MKRRPGECAALALTSLKVFALVMTGLGLPVIVMFAVSFLLVLLRQEPSQIERYPSPDGRFVAVVDHRGIQLLEDGARIWIETRDGDEIRRWPAGCVNGDLVHAVTWTGPATAGVDILSTGTVLPLRLDPATGRPLNRADHGYTRDFGCD